MTTTTPDGKEIINTLYHSGVVSVLTIAYAELGKKLLKKQPPKLDLNFKDFGMLSLYILAATATRDMLVKHKIIPPDINLPDNKK